MYINTEKSTIIEYVQCCTEGLDTTKDVFKGFNIRNDIHLFKYDRISEALLSNFGNRDNFKVIKLRRGGYNVVLVFDILEKTLYSVMSDGNFNRKMKRKDKSKVSYLDALLEYNKQYIGDLDQVKMDFTADIFNSTLYKKRVINEEIRNLLDGVEPLKYIMVKVDIHYLELVSVEALLVNNNFDIIETNDWSEYIDVDYGNLEEKVVSIKKENNYSLGITVKKNLKENFNKDLTPLKKEENESEN